MTAVETLERVLASGVLNARLTTVPARGATAEELSREDLALPKTLSTSHRRLLCRWNGLDLDVVRFYGCGDTEPGIRRLSAEQRSWPELRGYLIIGSDPSGFLYLEDARAGAELGS